MSFSSPVYSADEYLEQMQNDSDASILKGHHPFTRLQLLNHGRQPSECYHEFFMVSIRQRACYDGYDALHAAEAATLTRCEPYLDFIETQDDGQFFIRVVIERDLLSQIWCIRVQMHLNDPADYETFLTLLKLNALPEWEAITIT